MFRAKDLIGISVFDGSETLVGTIDGIGIDYNNGQAFLVVMGDALKEIRDRVRELIPFTEVYEIKNSKIYLLPTFNDLRKIIKQIPEDQIHISTLAQNIMGFKVFDGEGESVGQLLFHGIERNQGKMFMIVSGEKIKAIRGREYEMIPVQEVKEVDEQVKLDKPFNALKELILKEHPYRWEEI